jgi:hypothetical protein
MWKALMTAAIGACLMLAPAFAAYAPRRIVTAIHATDGTFECRASASEPSRTYKVTDHTVFRTSGQKVRLRLLWNKGSLSSIKVGDVVTVEYHLDGGEPVADRIAVSRSQ